MKNPLFVGVRIPEIGKIIPLESRIPNIAPLTLKILKSCLIYDTDERATIKQLLEDPYFHHDRWAEKFEIELKYLIDSEKEKDKELCEKTKKKKQKKIHEINKQYSKVKKDYRQPFEDMGNNNNIEKRKVSQYHLNSNAQLDDENKSFIPPIFSKNKNSKNSNGMILSNSTLSINSFNQNSSSNLMNSSQSSSVMSNMSGNMHNISNSNMNLNMNMGMSMNNPVNPMNTMNPMTMNMNMNMNMNNMANGNQNICAYINTNYTSLPPNPLLFSPQHNQLYMMKKNNHKLNGNQMLFFPKISNSNTKNKCYSGTMSNIQSYDPKIL